MGHSSTQSVLPIQGYIRPRSQATTLPSFGSSSEPPTCAAAGVVDTEQVAPRRVGKASKSVSIFARAPVCPDTCRYCRRKPVMLRLLMMITRAMIVSSGCCIRNEYLHGNFRSCLCVNSGVRGVPPNGVELAKLMNVIYACGVNERWSRPLPPLGAGTLGQKEKKRSHELAVC